jgi:Flp pilus assembly protein TadD
MRFGFLVLLSVTAVIGNAQHLTYRDWQEQSFRDIRLLPEYGHRPKNAEMQASDSAFVAQTLAVIPDRKQASDHLVELGFSLLVKGDMTKAMYRFNQAYLVEPGNPAIYRGYGAFFVALDRNTEAAQQYQKGLAVDSTNSDLMTDMAGVFLAEYHNLRKTSPERADQLLSGATTLLKRARQYDPKNAEAAFKLSVCHLRREECDEAWRAFTEAGSLGSPSITDSYQAELQRNCPRHP